MLDRIKLIRKKIYNKKREEEGSNAGNIEVFLPTRICEEIGRYLPETIGDLLDGFIVWGNYKSSIKGCE